MIRATLLFCLCIFGAFACGPFPPPSMTNTVTQYGVTFTFDQNYQVGQYINGDFWVLGSPTVTINSITPTFANGLNGFMVDPDSFMENGYDNRLRDYSANLVPSLPLTLTPAPVTSVVKAVSVAAGAGCLPCLQTAVVLTIVDSQPDNEGSTEFRPGYFGNGTNKDLRSRSELDLAPFGPFSDINNINDPVTLSDVETRYQRLQLDHLLSLFGSFMHPQDNMATLGTVIGFEAAESILRLLYNDVDEDTCALHLVVQAGIDYYSAFKNGMYWPPVNGEGNGRKILIAYTALALADTQMQNAVSNAVSDIRLSNQFLYGTVFLEDGFFSPSSNGYPLYGERLNFDEGLYSLAEYVGLYWNETVEGTSGSGSFADPYLDIDGGPFPGANTQRTNSMIWKGVAVALCAVPELKTVWGNDLFSLYAERWVECGPYGQPDPCAPATGTCDGKYCSTANAELVCGDIDSCVIDTTQFGVTYGPDGTGCVLDEEECDGIGRFPQLDQVNADQGPTESEFINQVWTEYYSCDVMTCETSNSNVVQTDANACSGLNPPSSTSSDESSAAVLESIVKAIY